MVVQAGLDLKQDPISKITKAKLAGSMAQVVECLFSKHNTLNSIPSTKKKKKIRLVMAFVIGSKDWKGT
jgi:hypothetical protein